MTGRTDVSIVGGTIRNFEAGVRTRDSSGIVVRSSTLDQNVDGIDLQGGSLGMTIRHNAFTQNRTRGIMIRGRQHAP